MNYSNLNPINISHYLTSPEGIKIEQKAFTLVELIVVIAILAILWTIWFVSYTWFLWKTRDSNRLSQLEQINNWLESYKNRWKLPFPDDMVNIYASWTIIWYQWYAWKTVLNKIWYQKWWKDPLDDKYYSYIIDSRQKSLQLLWFLENDISSDKEVTFKWTEKWELRTEDLVDVILEKVPWKTILGNAGMNWESPNPNTISMVEGIEHKTYSLKTILWVNATDYTSRFITVYWSSIWVMLDSSSNPIQENTTLRTLWLDIVTSTWTYTAYFTDKEKISWTWNILKVIQWSSAIWWVGNTCKDYLDKSKTLFWKDWLYQIKPSSLTGSFQVYCDMTTDWWWWTLAWYAWDNTTWFPDLSQTVWTYNWINRTWKASIPYAVSLAKLSTEFAIWFSTNLNQSWSISSYYDTVSFKIPEPSAVTLSPTDVTTADCTKVQTKRLMPVWSFAKCVWSSLWNGLSQINCWDSTTTPAVYKKSLWANRASFWYWLEWKEWNCSNFPNVHHKVHVNNSSSNNWAPSSTNIYTSPINWSASSWFR